MGFRDGVQIDGETKLTNELTHSLHLGLCLGGARRKRRVEVAPLPVANAREDGGDRRVALHLGELVGGVPRLMG